MACSPLMELVVVGSGSGHLTFVNLQSDESDVIHDEMSTRIVHVIKLYHQAVDCIKLVKKIQKIFFFIKNFFLGLVGKENT